jgi:hypothetical protein
MNEQDNAGRKHDLLMRAYKTGVPESALTDDLDALEEIVKQYEGQVKGRMDEATKGGKEGDPARIRQQLLMEAFRAGVELTEAESETITVEELQKRIDDARRNG